jgi:putative endonuclease
VPPRKNNGYGKIAEDFALSTLAQSGHKIIARNFHSRFGEIDLIAVKDGVLIFVEVKARSSRKFGSPEEAVTKYKLQKIQKTAEYFCLMNQGLPKKMRIEVFAIEIEDGTVREHRITKVI